ncbi:unnamed protein product [Sphagnum jensenii]
MNKASLALRGVPPSGADYAQLQNARLKGGTESFLRAKFQSWMRSPEYTEKFRERVVELLQLRPSEHPFFMRPAEKSHLLDARDNSTDELILRIAKNNLSWDELITAKSYRLFDGDQTDRHHYSDAGFFSELRPDLSPRDVNLKDPWHRSSDKTIRFTQDDPRIAGVITSPRFLTRYVTTAINKNRRRAAAIESIFLCDSMVAVIPNPFEKNIALEWLQFPFGKSADAADSQHVPGEDPHGSLHDCRSCHDKLDPLGAVFKGSPYVPSKKPCRAPFSSPIPNRARKPLRSTGSVNWRKRSLARRRIANAKFVISGTGGLAKMCRSGKKE